MLTEASVTFISNFSLSSIQNCLKQRSKVIMNCCAVCALSPYLKYMSKV